MNHWPAATPLCVYCWPVITPAYGERDGHPCCGSAACLAADKPALPAFMLKPRPESLFDEPI